ncbi:hypothetical protein HY345_03380 [Candidatus Microgenomates bacterium]|nr:hypothetical protein [Candidatus Microgenomates bacterium]
MSAELEKLLADYRTGLSGFAIPDVAPDIDAAKEMDRRLVTAIIALQKSLQPNQRLILMAKLSAENFDDDERNKVNRYADEVKWAPVDFTQHLKQLVEKGKAALEEQVDWDKPPAEIEVVIPPNMYPEMEVDGDSSRRDQYNFLAASQIFLRPVDFRVPLLGINPTGGFPAMDELCLHPSVITGFRIETTNNVSVTSQVQFRLPQPAS